MTTMNEVKRQIWLAGGTAGEMLLTPSEESFAKMAIALGLPPKLIAEEIILGWKKEAQYLTTSDPAQTPS